MNKKSEPILNVPGVVTLTLALTALVHVLRVYALTSAQDVDFLLYFAFIPARYEASLLPSAGFPGGVAADLWTFVTYAFIHADVTHLTVNGIWLLAFGSAVARRFGAIRFAMFFAVTAAAGAAAHLVTHGGELYPMVGASASISGLMAAAVRFIFQAGGPLALWRRGDTRAFLVAAVPLVAALRDPRILTFLGVWFGLNVIFGIGAVAFPGVEQSVAWQAHIGGFLAGLLLFAAFDPVAADRPTTRH
ncbi:MAG: rhomboid family intramembrane serine protease [Proteobacteria bacterium]|nr:rhomboid family intramembrane serine protease [Pseudomonadota bacterium]